MHVEYAQLPPPEDSADRIFITDNAVIVLDGATSLVPVPVTAQAYAHHLGRRLADQLTTRPRIDLRVGLAEAIRQTAETLDLRAGESPSSTVTVLREGANEYDVLVLGDTPVRWGTADGPRGLSDNRLASIAASQRQAYRGHLRAGHGFDERHQESLRAIQRAQRRHRNIEGGYWIAEADPTAAYHALSAAIPRADLKWAVIATDGAFNLIDHSSNTAWGDVAQCSSQQLAELLHGLFSWEIDHDPLGRLYPRAKRHDDKTIATLSRAARSHNGEIESPSW